MGSIITTQRPRMKKSDYEALKKNLDREHFYNFYLNNCNDFVCDEFNINLNTLYRLVKELDIKLTPEQFKYRNKVASEQKSLETFGVTNPFAATIVQDRIKETNLAKYGVENPFAADEIKDKIKQTNLEKYGVENVSQNPDITQKAKNTCIEKYGVDNYAKTAECREKAVNTMLARYGRADLGQFGTAEHVDALLEKYGTIYVSQIPEVQEKARQTSLAKYGSTHYSKTFDFHNRTRKRYIYKEEAFDSLPELAVWVYCIDNNIEIKRNPCYFEYNINGKKHRYFPDFEIAGQVVEIKGDHFFKEDGTMQNPFDSSQDALYEAKHQCGLQNNVQFWRGAEYEKYVQYFNENYAISDYIFKKNDEVN